VCLTAATLDAVVASILTATRGLDLRRHVALLPLATLLEDVAGLGASLAAGGECLLPGADRTGLGAGGVDVARLTALVTAAAPHSLILVPELLQALVLAAGAGWVPPASLRVIAVGGARVSPALLARATGLGLPVYEGYGLSECGSVLCLNQPGATRPGSVGRPLPHARLRVDDRGELHVAAPAFAGYLGGGAPAAEFATGDLGRIDADGFVYVDGRAKNLLITSLGRNVAPEWVEGELLRQPAIAQACVAGDDRPYLTAVIVPRTPGADVTGAVASANAALPDYAQVRRHAVVAEPFTAANGLLTTNGRPRRDRILARHGALIASLYPAPAGAAVGT
jgi:acyl-CoA synthetase (AMP-forming)/AMP-acid ligase II